VAATYQQKSSPACSPNMGNGDDCNGPAGFGVWLLVKVGMRIDRKWWQGCSAVWTTNEK
jgi:hypothetical protein